MKDENEFGSYVIYIYSLQCIMGSVNVMYPPTTTSWSTNLVNRENSTTPSKSDALISTYRDIQQLSRSEQLMYKEHILQHTIRFQKPSS